MKEIDDIRMANENKTKHYLSFTYDRARVRERLKHFFEATIVSVSTCIRSIDVVISHTTTFFPSVSFRFFFVLNFIYQMPIVSCVHMCVEFSFSLSLSQWVFGERARSFIYLWISFFRNDWFHRLWISQLLNVRIISRYSDLMLTCVYVFVYNINIIFNFIANSKIVIRSYTDWNYL